ncbi:MAG TPA: hypothetical protein VK457_00825 [Chloroflexota bacterium]|nr:hypothetical protein [Chloroflexota bacterium]
MLSTDRNWQRITRLGAFVRERGTAVGALAIAWLTGQDVVGSMIAGSATPNSCGKMWKPRASASNPMSSRRWMAWWSGASRTTSCRPR